jgi:hypothetical protein
MLERGGEEEEERKETNKRKLFKAFHIKGFISREECS